MQKPAIRWAVRISALLVCAVSLVTLQACGNDPGSGLGAISGQTLTGLSLTTLANLNSITNSQALALFATQGFADCYPGGAVTYTAYQEFEDEHVQGTVAKPVDVSALNWSSSNAKIATVNKGVVTCAANGTATITATLPNSNCAGQTCKAPEYVVVGSAKHTLTLTPATGTYKVGDIIVFTAILNTVLPDGSVTSQDVSSSINGFLIADSLIGSGKQVIWFDPAPKPTIVTQLKALNPGTAWGFAQYPLPSNSQDVVQSDVVTITVQ
jgi:hypothetical protein